MQQILKIMGVFATMLVVNSANAQYYCVAPTYGNGCLLDSPWVCIAAPDPQGIITGGSLIIYGPSALQYINGYVTSQPSGYWSSGSFVSGSVACEKLVGIGLYSDTACTNWVMNLHNVTLTTSGYTIGFGVMGECPGM